MIMNCFKKYTALLFFSCMFSTLLHFSTYCMHTEQNYKSLERYAQNIIRTVDKTAFFCLAALSQLPNVNGYAPVTQAACYEACAQNCSMSNIYPMCDITFEKVGLPLILIGTGFYVFGLLAGCVAYTCQSNSSLPINTANE